MLNWLSELFARIKAQIGVKLLVSLFSLVALFVVLGAVGLAALRSSEQRTQSLIELQRRIAAYQSLQSNTTALRFIVANAFLETDPRQLDAARRQIGNITYDFHRAEFIAAGDREKIATIEDDYAELVAVGYEVLDQIESGEIEAARANQVRAASRLGDRIERLTYSLINSAEAEMLREGAEGQRNYQVSQYGLAGTAVFSVLIALVIGYALSYSVVRPLQKTNRRLDQISSGDFSSKLVVSNRDELGDLAQNVNRMSAELESLYQRLAAASQHKTEFLATMSHEIRTPMNAILSMGELMLDTPLTREQRDYVQTSHASGKALLTIIDDILDFSKIEAGELELETEPFDLRDCIESALDMIAYVAAPKNLDLAYRIADGTPEAVRGDVTRLRQVLINLVNNAVKFTERGEVAVEARFEPARDDKTCGAFHFEVRDTGIGIPEDRLDRLFESFKQVDASTKRKYGGTGLGLAISKRLVGLMGGDIGVRSKVGQGTTFFFDVQIDLQAVPATAGIASATGLDSVRLLLLCDGGSTNCRQVKRYASAWSMETVVAETLTAAEELIADGSEFDVLLVDADYHLTRSADLAGLLDVARGLPTIAMVRRGRPTEHLQDFTTIVKKPLKPSLLYDAFVDVMTGGRSTEDVHTPTTSAFDAGLAARCPLNILVADDHPTNRKLALQILERLGYAADTATNGREVLSTIREKEYDLVLMDIHMPEMDGLEATTEIRRLRPDGWPRVVVVTANVLQGDWDACRDAGAVAIVRKPIEVAKLIAAIEDSHAALIASGRDTQRTTGSAMSQAPAPAHKGAHEPASPDRIDRTAIARLLDLVGGDPRKFHEVLESFIEEAPHLLADLEEGAAGDAKKLHMAAHTMKSSAADFGVIALVELCVELERLSRQGPTKEARQLARNAAMEWQAAEVELKALSAGMNSIEAG